MSLCSVSLPPWVQSALAQIGKSTRHSCPQAAPSAQASVSTEDRCAAASGGRVSVHMSLAEFLIQMPVRFR